MSRYKVLPLDLMFGNAAWEHDDGSLSKHEITEAVGKDLFQQGYREIAPRFNREGFYYDREKNEAWHEWRGRAWFGEVSSFKYELSSLDARHLEPPEVAAIKTLIAYGGCPTSLLRIYQKHRDNMRLRENVREVRKICARSTE